MSTTHTPGPWATDDYEFLWRDSDGGLTAHLEAGPAQIYFTPHDTADRQRALNDARLIAAAPELLAMLERLVPAPPSLDELDLGEEDNQLLDEARALIAKAKGVK